ncbi:MAG: FGGY family carbohydrate kinase [Patescibacteria group bacterium]|jgi:sugar (pentulose or hexulose) kinase
MAEKKAIHGSVVIAFDLGTGGKKMGGLTGLVIRCRDGKVLGEATAGYDMVEGLPGDHKEQRPSDWVNAFRTVMNSLHQQFELGRNVVCIGLAGQMHGEVGTDEAGQVWPTARLWCDDRNAEEGQELTKLFGTKVPARMTVARWLWTCRYQPEKAKACTALTTPIGWLFRQLTGQRCLGIGEASGMFPVDPRTGQYQPELVAKFNTLTADCGVKPIEELLPRICCGGSYCGGELNKSGARLTGLPIGTPVAPAEGDQPAALAGSFIGEPGSLAYSFGTSTCGNLLSATPFVGVYQPIDYFLDPIGQYVRMIWTRSGTTFVNLIMELFRQARGDEKIGDTFAALMPLAAKARKDAGGLLGLPFMGIEPGIGLTVNGVPALLGMTGDNFTVGNLIHLCFTLSVFGLKNGLDVLGQQGIRPSQIVVTGGATKDEAYIAKLIAGVTATPVCVRRAANEGTAYGAGLLAIFAWQRQANPDLTYAEFLQKMLGQETGKEYRPDPAEVEIYEAMYRRYSALMPTEQALLVSGAFGD